MIKSSEVYNNTKNNLKPVKKCFKSNEIKCVYNKTENSISLLHDYNDDQSDQIDEYKNMYNEVKIYMKDIYKNGIELYINNKKIKFNTKYSSPTNGKINVKFIFNKLLINTSFLFSECSSLESID